VTTPPSGATGPGSAVRVVIADDHRLMREGTAALLNVHAGIEVVGLASRLTHRPSELSGGQQQRVAVARALVTKPDVVFADEPTGNLDSRSSSEVLSFLRRSVDEMRQTIVMVTHDPKAAAYADRVIFLADGKIVGELREPTAESVLDFMKDLEAPSAGASQTDEDPTLVPPARRGASGGSR